MTEPLFDLFQWPLRPGAWTVLTGIATNTACALVGCFLVLRRMSMMGDALSHAVLPGLIVAFLFSGSTGLWPMFLGAAAVGLVTTLLTQTLHQHGRVPSDASMGVVYTSLFALGVVLVKLYVSDIHFDVACVYEGSLDLTPLAERIAGVPRPLLTTGVVLVVNAVVIALFWKELRLSSFDPGLSTTMGFPATLMHYLLMVLVALTVVASFEAVGSILVVAMLIVPAATAHLLADRLAPMMLIAVAIAAVSAVLGWWFAVLRESNTAGMTAVVVGGFYFSAALLAPRHGVLSAVVRNARRSLRIVREDLLAMLYRVEEVASGRRLQPSEARAAVGGGWAPWWELKRLAAGGLVSNGSGEVGLTERGRSAAAKLVRTHRLWEAYLVEHLNLPLDHVHEPAHRVEHYIDDTLLESIEGELGGSEVDPHGREIPE